jgi:hypothetical protein
MSSLGLNGTNDELKKFGSYNYAQPCVIFNHASFFLSTEYGSEVCIKPHSSKREVSQFYLVLLTLTCQRASRY